MARGDKALDRAVRLIHEDGFGIEACLALFSAAEADRLRPLLQTIAAVEERARTAPAPVRQEENKAVFLGELSAFRATEAMKSSGERITAPFRNWLSTRLGRTLAAATAAIVLTGGVATAAGRSGPESSLYPVKRTVEAVETVWPKSDYAQAKLRLELAETRLVELEQAEDPQDAAYERLPQEFNDELLEAKNLASRLSYVERRHVAGRYKELKLRYKNVSHPRLKESGGLPEKKERNRGSKAPPAEVPAPPLNQVDEVTPGDGGGSPGENSGSREESQPAQNKPVQNINGAPAEAPKSDDEAVRKLGAERSKDDRKKAEAHRRRQKRRARRKANERKRAAERRESGDRRYEVGF